MHFTPAPDNVFCPKQSRYAFHGNVARPPAALQLCLKSIEGNSTTSAQWSAMVDFCCVLICFPYCLLCTKNQFFSCVSLPFCAFWN